MALRQSKPKGPIPAEVFEKVVIPNATEFIRQSVLGRLAGKESSNANVAEAFTKMLETRVVAGEHKSQWVLLHLYGMQCNAEGGTVDRQAKQEVVVQKAAMFVAGRLDDIQSKSGERFDFADTLARILASASGGKDVLAAIARDEKVVIPNATEFIREGVTAGLAGRESSNVNVGLAFAKMLQQRSLAEEAPKPSWNILLSMAELQRRAENLQITKKPSDDEITEIAGRFITARLDDIQSKSGERFDFAEALARMLAITPNGNRVLTAMSNYQLRRGVGGKKELPRRTDVPEVKKGV